MTLPSDLGEPVLCIRPLSLVLSPFAGERRQRTQEIFCPNFMRKVTFDG